MRFQVSRASTAHTDQPPCAGAIRHDDRWYVDIDDLAGLLAWMDLHCDQNGLVLSRQRWGARLPDIVIFDDYL